MACYRSADVIVCSCLQILVYEGEMERAQGQLEAEMQNLEAEKNRMIEEAFIRAESEMKAVHENLAGQTQLPQGSILSGVWHPFYSPAALANLAFKLLS